MGTDGSWIDGVDTSRPSAARVYDYYLGGFHNFAVDREMGDQAMAMWPQLPAIMRANRAFLQRAVTRLAHLGVRQFIDLGSGIPTVGSVHEVAQAIDPQTRVVYVDSDPVAVAHSRSILSGNASAAALLGDLRRPDEVLADPVMSLIDRSQPVAVLMVAVLHFVADDEARSSVAAWREACGVGSYLAMSHAASDLEDEELTSRHRQLYQRTATPMRMRDRAEVAELLQGYELLSPGLVELDNWFTVSSPVDESADDEGTATSRTPAWAALGSAC